MTSDIAPKVKLLPTNKIVRGGLAALNAAAATKAAITAQIRAQPGTRVNISTTRAPMRSTISSTRRWALGESTIMEGPCQQLQMSAMAENGHSLVAQAICVQGQRRRAQHLFRISRLKPVAFSVTAIEDSAEPLMSNHLGSGIRVTTS